MKNNSELRKTQRRKVALHNLQRRKEVYPHSWSNKQEAEMATLVRRISEYEYGISV